MSGIRIIFVCSGNICRSPMAEVLAKSELEKAGVPAHVISMGTLGLFGRAAAQHAITVSRSNGLDLSRHSSQGVSYGILARADAVMVMERAHRDQILERQPSLLNIRLFAMYADDNEGLDVVDPVGGSLADFERCFQRLRHATAGMLSAIKAHRL